jgi:hypothetical protein
VRRHDKVIDGEEQRRHETNGGNWRSGAFSSLSSCLSLVRSSPHHLSIGRLCLYSFRSSLNIRLFVPHVVTHSRLLPISSGPGRRPPPSAARRHGDVRRRREGPLIPCPPSPAAHVTFPPSGLSSRPPYGRPRAGW